MAVSPIPVPAPPAQPPRHSLLVAAEVITGGDDRWTVGYTFRPEGAGTGGGVIAPDCGPIDGFDSDRPPAWVEVQPFYVFDGDQCSRMSQAGSYDEVAARARRNLQASESHHIAAEFWTGTLADDQSWTGEARLRGATEVGVGPLAPAEALACLEQALQTNRRGRRGMIHATAGTVTTWQAENLLRREGGQVLTVLDTIVVTDSGYDGSSPDGDAAADGAVWAYATGMVQVRLTAPQPLQADEAQAMNRQTNNIEVLVARLAGINFDTPGVWGASVDVPVCA